MEKNKPSNGKKYDIEQSHQKQLLPGIKKKGKPRGRPFEKGKLTTPRPFKSKAELHGELDPHINARGRPKAIGASYTAVLESLYPMHLLTPEQLERVQQYTGNVEAVITYAEAIALSVVTIATLGDVSAAREIRTATEGNKIIFATWQTDIIDALKQKMLSADEVIDRLGFEQAQPILIAAGITPIVSTQQIEPEITNDAEPNQVT